MSQVAVDSSPSLDPAMEAKRRSTVTWVVTLATIGLIFDGYDLVVYGVILPMFRKNPDLIGPVNESTAGLLGSYALFGVLVGALTAGAFGDTIGRRKVLLTAYVWFSVGMLISSFMTTTTSFGIMRFITGLGIGAVVGTTAALVAEFAPPGKKNLINAITYSGVPLGSMLAALAAITLASKVGWTGLFRIGALPILTLFPLALWKMPESVAWLAARGRMDEARRTSAKTGMPIPAAPSPSGDSTRRVEAGPVGFAGLFSNHYLLATILLGLTSATGLMVVYMLQTWLPTLMGPLLGSKAALWILFFVNAGAAIGALFASRVADRFGAQPVVAVCFLLGAIFVVLLTMSRNLWLLVPIAMVVGLGSSGTQILIYGMVASYYRTNVRGAGTAWCAGFGRLGGVGGPYVGGLLAATFATTAQVTKNPAAGRPIFWAIAGIAVVGMVFCLLVPKSKDLAVSEIAQTTPSIGLAERTAAAPAASPRMTAPAAGAAPGSGVPAAAPAPGQGLTATGAKPRLYSRILIAIDPTPNREHEQLMRRCHELGEITGASIYVLYVAPGHIAPRVSPGSGHVSAGVDADVDHSHVQAMQAFIDSLTASGIEARGEIVAATEHDIAEVILARATQHDVDLIILGHELHVKGRHTHVAERVLESHPHRSILLAKPPVGT
ncbi:MAG: MFS transporter [Tetrasphaera sp.]